MPFLMVHLLAQQSSKNGNKPKKSVGKSLLKKPYPSVAQAIKKQVCALFCPPLSPCLLPSPPRFFYPPVSPAVYV